VSDFMTADDVAQGRDFKVLAARHDVVGVVVEDPAEYALPRNRPMRGAVR
jgi:hypothetical protein